MANFGLQQYYTNAQQNRFQAEEAQKERDWRSSEAWKSFGRDLLGRLGQTGMNIGQQFAEDYTPTRELARENLQTQMGYTKEDRDAAAARARGEAAAGSIGMQNPYGAEGRPADVPGVSVPTVQSGATPPAPSGPLQSMVQQKMQNIGGMSVPPRAGMSEVPATTEAGRFASEQVAKAPQYEQWMRESDKALQAQGARQPAVAPSVVPPTATPSPPAGQTMRDRYTHTNPEFGSQEAFNRVLEAVTGKGKGATQDDIAMAQMAIAKAAAAQRANKVSRDAALLARDKAMLPLYTAALGQTQSGKSGGKYGASYTRPMVGLDQGRLTQEFGTGGMGSPLTPVTPPALPAPGAGGGGGGGGGRILPQLVNGVIKSQRGDLLTTNEGYGLVKSAAETMVNSGEPTKVEYGTRLLNELQGMKPNSPEFIRLYAKYVTSQAAVQGGQTVGQDMPVTKGSRSQSQFDDKQARNQAQFERRMDLQERRLKSLAGKMSDADKQEIQNLRAQINRGMKVQQGYDASNNSVITKIPGADAAELQQRIDNILSRYAGDEASPTPVRGGTDMPQEGDTATDRSGRAIIVRGGKWVLQ